jgi:integrase/recombinase XerD
MQRGLMTGKPFSPLTIRDYETYVRCFLKARPGVSFETLEAELSKVPAAQYGKRFKLYKGVLCFGKFLIRQGALEKSFLEEAKPLFPKRHAPPKRTVLNEAQLKQLLEAARTPFQKTMLTVLAGTGLRASEAVGLKRTDVDLERGVLAVRKGKGNKTRTLGLSPALVSALASYFETVSSDWVFSDEAGKPLGRTSLYHRLQRLGDRVGVEVSPHSLRRAFVTINASKGRPLVYLQKSCGHSDIRTTMGYCLTTEQEVVEAMKGWD